MLLRISPFNRKATAEPIWNLVDTQPGVQELLQNIKRHLPELQSLLATSASEAEDLRYRFYHQSLKVYGIQDMTLQIVGALKKLNPRPDAELNGWFMDIVSQGTGKRFNLSHNTDWTNITRPMLEAHFHAHYFLEMACKYGVELEVAPSMMPSGWAAVLYLYNQR